MLEDTKSLDAAHIQQYFYAWCAYKKTYNDFNVVQKNIKQVSYYLLLIWGGAKVSSIAIEIAIELFLQEGQRYLCGIVWFDRDRTTLLTMDNAPLLINFYTDQILCLSTRVPV